MKPEDINTQTDHGHVKTDDLRCLNTNMQGNLNKTFLKRQGITAQG